MTEDFCKAHTLKSALMPCKNQEEPREMTAARAPSISSEIVGPGFPAFAGVFIRALCAREGWATNHFRPGGTPYLFTIHYSLFTREGKPLPYNGRPTLAPTFLILNS